MRIQTSIPVDLAVKHGGHGIRILILVVIVVVVAALAVVLWRVTRKRRDERPDWPNRDDRLR